MRTRIKAWVAVAAVMAGPAALAQVQKFGDWEMGRTEQGELYAATMNESGSILGYWCGDASLSQCEWVLVTSTGCRVGATTSVLLNNSDGAAAASLRCSGRTSEAATQQQHRYEIEGDEAIQLLQQSTGRTGLAVPIQDDQFKVLRFSMNGSSGARSALRAVASAASRDGESGRRPTRSLGDERI